MTCCWLQSARRNDRDAATGACARRPSASAGAATRSETRMLLRGATPPDQQEARGPPRRWDAVFRHVSSLRFLWCCVRHRERRVLNKRAGVRWAAAAVIVPLQVKRLGVVRGRTVILDQEVEPPPERVRDTAAEEQLSGARSADRQRAGKIRDSTNARDQPTKARHDARAAGSRARLTIRIRTALRRGV
jgi:hypothetical protein